MVSIRGEMSPAPLIGGWVEIVKDCPIFLPGGMRICQSHDEGVSTLGSGSGLDGSKGQVLGGASGGFAPLIKQASVAGGELLLGLNSELVGNVVDPGWRTFEFGEDSEGCFIDDTVTVQFALEIVRIIGPFGAPLFIEEDGHEAEGGENFG